MGKPKSNSNKAHNKQQPKSKSKKNKQINNKPLSSDEQQVDDIMAWGRKKENYYKQDEEEYSSISQQERQAKDIYENLYNNYLNDQDVYDIPKEEKQAGNGKQDTKQKHSMKQQTQKQRSQKPSFEQQFAQEQDQQGLPEEYITQELLWVLQLYKDMQFYEQGSLLSIYQKLLKSYLTVIVSIKELKVPYIQFHPIIPLAVNIKTKITILMKKLQVKQLPAKNQSKNKYSAKNKKISTVQQSSMQEQQDEKDDEEVEDYEYNDQQDQVREEENDFVDDWSQNDKKLRKPASKKPLKNQSYPDHCFQAAKTQQNQHKKGLQFYKQMKQKMEKEKKIKKQQKKSQHMLSKRPTFKQTKQNQGRFASELILKNKGLIKKRKKIDGNSRVKLRMKYQKKKAIHRAKTGHFVRKNPGRAYEGQANIRYGKIAGVRLK